MTVVWSDRAHAQALGLVLITLVVLLVIEHFLG